MQTYIAFRPFMLYFLREIKAYYELIIYSRMAKPYLDFVISYIEGREGKIFSYVLNNDNCIATDGASMKCIELLKEGRDVSNILFVDSNLKEHICHILNYVPVSPYTGPNSTDFELIKLQKFLKRTAEGSVPVSDIIHTRINQIFH
jgi:TFIIF-interacting CTD phosphatase-like protein